MINELVQKLSKGTHKISINDRGESLSEVKERINNGFINVKFIETKGGTELGINIDQEKTSLGEANFDKGTGNI